GVFEVSPDRKPGREPGDSQFHVHQESREVGGCRLTLEVRVGGDDHLGHGAVRESLHQLTDAQVVRPDTVDGADGPAEHVVQAAELAGSLNRHHIFRLFDDADGGGRPAGVTAHGTGVFFAHVSADLAEANLLAHLGQNLREAGDIKGFRLQNMKRDALRRLRSDTRQSTEFVDELLNDSFVHGLIRSRGDSRAVWLLLDEVRAENLTNNGLPIATVAGRIASAGGWRSTL